jgi:sortase B
MNRVWNVAALLARCGDYMLNAAIVITLIVAFLLGNFGLWDTLKIYQDASVSPDLLEYKPTSTGKDTPNPTLLDLQKVNPDVCAWLTIDDTHIDYPVVQGQSNVDYLNQDVDGSFSLSGSIFLDYQNDNDFSDSYSLIYGHHMDGEVMFGEIPYFLESNYFDSHTSGIVFTPKHTYYIQWFACMETNAYDDVMYNPTEYSDQKSMSKLLDYIKAMSTQYRDVSVSASDRLVALSTCTSTATNGRVILVGRFDKDVQK